MTNSIVTPKFKSVPDSALALAGLGLRVVPAQTIRLLRGGCTCPRGEVCDAPGKHPLIKGWRDAATTDPATVRKWFSAHPRANVAVATGPASGVFVLDVDPRNGGTDTLAAIEDRHGPLPVTWTARTGGGGLHAYFRWPTGRRIKSVAGALGDGLDVKADGGLVIAPPSRHASGGTYEWITPPTAETLADAPPWLLDLIDPPAKRRPAAGGAAKRNGRHDRDAVAKYAREALAGECVEVAAAREGKRNDTLNAAAFTAGTLVGADALDEAEAAAELRAAAAACGLGDAEAAATIRSGLAAGLKSPRDLSDIGAAGKPARGGPPTEDGDKKKKKGSVASRLVKLVTDDEEAELWHDRADGEAYATVPLDLGNAMANWPLRSRGFKDWLLRQWWLEKDDDEGGVSSAQAVQDALATLAGLSVHEGDAHTPATRVAGRDGGAIYLDLCDPVWRAAEVTADGWRVVDRPPVRFIRRRGMLALPEPQRGGRVDDLRHVVNVPDDDAWRLIVAWLVAALRPGRPFPVLVVNGEQGSAKSTLCKMLRALIDPSVSPLRRPPRDERDLMIAAQNAWIVAYDNLSGLRGDLSDALCSLATGGGFATRELYSDDAEKLFSATRPIIVNGIDAVATRPDLLDRAVVVTLPAIPDAARRDEATIWRDFDEMRPRVLGALLDAVACALQRLPDVRLPRAPRMADFARWTEAAAPALGWAEGEFLAAYAANRETATAGVLDDAAIAGPVMALIDAAPGGQWTGTAADLLAEAERLADDRTRKRRDWPATPARASAALRRIAPALRRAGIDVELRREGRDRRRTIRITRAASTAGPEDLPVSAAGDLWPAADDEILTGPYAEGF